MDQHPVRGLVGQVSIQQWVPGWIGIISMMDGCEWIYDWRLNLRLSDSLELKCSACRNPGVFRAVTQHARPRVESSSTLHSPPSFSRTCVFRAG